MARMLAASRTAACRSQNFTFSRILGGVFPRILILPELIGRFSVERSPERRSSSCCMNLAMTSTCQTLAPACRRDRADMWWKIIGLAIVVALPTLFWTSAMGIGAGIAGFALSLVELLSAATIIATWCLVVGRSLMGSPFAVA